jgi:hypothetical protein
MNRTGLLAGGAVGLAALSGCVVAIGNESEYPSGKVALTATEKSSLPAVRSKSELPTIRDKYADQLAKLGPTTTVEEFKTLFPEAKFVERRGEPPVDAYSVELVQKYRQANKTYGYVSRDESWFYFRNNVFVKWGAPHDFP